MADILSIKKRSWLMSRVKGKNTNPERLVFSFLRTKGIYFQKHYRNVSGSPDIAIPSKKIAVFINGDFWHGRYYAEAKQRWSSFWREKIKANRERDRRNCRKLRYNGWKVLNIWTGDLQRRPSLTLARIARFLQKDR